MLLMPLNGPNVATEKMLPIVTNVTSVSTEKYCRYLCTGPPFLSKNSRDTHGWANYCCGRILLMDSKVPVLLGNDAVIHLIGPIVAAEEYCQWS